MDTALRFLTHESPMHVALLNNVDAARRDQLLTAFEAALRTHVNSDGAVSFETPYVVVTARRR
jgi:hypothetical protein